MDIIKKRISEGLENVKNNLLKFVMLKVEFCNAVRSTAFSKAQLMYEYFKDKEDSPEEGKILSIRFDTLFSDGIKLLESELKNADGKFETHEKTAIQILENFFQKRDCYEESLKKVFQRNPVSETDITIALAEHLLGKLAPGKEYVIDKKGKGKGKCKCGCGVEPVAGSTGIGHEAVWHGYIDIILSSHLGLPVSSELAVKTVDKCEPDVYANEEEAAKEEEAETSTPRKQRKRDGDLEETNTSPGGKSIIEVKQSTSSDAIEQTLAQTIVFSLLQKQKHPDFKNFLVPNILMSSQEILIAMYDAEYDVLLCSNIIKLFDPFSFHLNPETVIILWMVLHYRMFCTGLLPMLHEYKSHFKELAEAKWDIYSKSLKSNVSSFPVIEKPDLHTDLMYTKVLC